VMSPRTHDIDLLGVPLLCSEATKRLLLPSLTCASLSNGPRRLQVYKAPTVELIIFRIVPPSPAALSPTIFSSGLQNAQTCRGYAVILQHERDSQKNTGRYYKNCMRCRDKNTSSRRVKRGQSPVDRSFRVTKPAAVSPRSFDYAAVSMQ
jgi:hypothetical protein